METRGAEQRLGAFVVYPAVELAIRAAVACPSRDAAPCELPCRALADLCGDLHSCRDFRREDALLDVKLPHNRTQHRQLEREVNANQNADRPLDDEGMRSAGDGSRH